MCQLPNTTEGTISGLVLPKLLHVRMDIEFCSEFQMVRTSVYHTSQCKREPAKYWLCGSRTVFSRTHKPHKKVYYSDYAQNVAKVPLYDCQGVCNVCYFWMGERSIFPGVKLGWTVSNNFNPMHHDRKDVCKNAKLMFMVQNYIDLLTASWNWLKINKACEWNIWNDVRLAASPRRC